MVATWAIILANAADLATYAMAVSALGPGGETNPLVRWVHANLGAAGLGAFKGVGVLLMLVLIAALPPGWRTPLAAFAVAVAVFGTATNLLSWAM